MATQVERKGHNNENNPGIWERLYHYHRLEGNIESNQMEQIEMQLQPSVNATECIVEIFGNLAQRNMKPFSNFEIGTFKSSHLQRADNSELGQTFTSPEKEDVTHGSG